MTNLPSQSSNLHDAGKPHSVFSQFELLDGQSNIASWSKNYLTFCQSNFGNVGQDISNQIATTTRHISQKPTYNDERLHPITGIPIPGSRQYEQAQPTNAQLVICSRSFTGRSN